MRLRANRVLLQVMVTGIFLLIAAAIHAGEIPSLNDSQLTRLQTAQDGIVALDEAALYPLLESAITWPASQPAGTQPAESVTAVEPDFQALHRDPAAYRGVLFTITGKLAAPPRAVGGLSRSGAWDGKLQQWTILVGPHESDVAVLYLVAPPSHWQRPRVGEPVKAHVRFYKIWQQPRAEDGEPAMFLTFVGRTIELDRAAIPPQEQRVVQGWFFWALTASLVSLAIIWNVARWFARQKALEAQAMKLAQASRESSLHDDVNLQERTHDAPLPEDPAEAMRELERRGKDEA